MTLLSELRVGILAESGVNEEQVVVPREFLEKAGVVVGIVSPQDLEVKAANAGPSSTRIRVDEQIAKTTRRYDCIIIPGGESHLKRLKDNQAVRRYIKSAAASGAAVVVVSESNEFGASLELPEDQLYTYDTTTPDRLEAFGQTVLEVLRGRLHESGHHYENNPGYQFDPNI